MEVKRCASKNSTTSIKHTEVEGERIFYASVYFGPCNNNINKSITKWAGEWAMATTGWN